MLTPSTAAFLVSEPGLAAVEATVRSFDGAGTPTVAMHERVRRDLGDPQLAAAVIAAAQARLRARDRWPDADRLLFTRAALEQASDPVVSAWRARRYADAPEVWDLCAGVGGDTLALAEVVPRVTAVDVDPGRLTLLAHNARVRRLSVTTRTGDALRVRPSTSAWLHADPARRIDGRRVRRLSETVPPVDALLDAHAGAPGFGVVVAPGTSLDDLPLRHGGGTEVEYVQVGWQLTEAVLWLGACRVPGRVATASLLPAHGDLGGRAVPGVADGALPAPGDLGGRAVPGVADGALPAPGDLGGRAVPGVADGALPAPGDLGGRAVSLYRDGPRAERLVVGEVGAYVVEVAPAAVRARLHDTIGRDVGARRIADRRALLTTDDRPPVSPWYRARPVLACLPARPKAVRAWLRRHDPAEVELVLHGMDLDVTRWWHALGRPPRGPAGLRIELVRRDDDAVALITRTDW